jgi:protein-disulfide isomerase
MITVSRRIWALCGFSLIGFAISVAQSKQFYEMRSGTAAFKSLCNINDKFNCDVIVMSKYAELFGGLPLSSFAAGWFVAIFFIALIARSAFWRRDSVRALFSMTFISVVMSAIWFYIMAAKLNTFCIECLAVDAVNIVSFLIVLSLRPEPLSSNPPQSSKLQTFAGITFASLLVCIVFLKQMETLRAGDEDIDLMVQAVLDAPVLAVASGPEFPSIGPANAPITIVEFSDFQCPYCRLGASTLKSLSYRFPGSIRIVLRNFPLDQACNPKMKSAGHAAACEAARAVHCAFQQGQFEAAYEQVFEHQDSLKPTVPTAMVQALPGIDGAKLEGCMGMPETNQAVLRDLNDGDLLGVQGTPSFFMNGKRVPGFPSINGWTRLVERMLAK